MFCGIIYVLKGNFRVSEMEIENLTLTDVIDANELHSILELFSAATGLSAAALNKNETFTSSANWCGRSDFCEKCLKKSTEGSDRCKKFTQSCIEDAKHSSRPIVKVCHTGMAEFAVPITVRSTLVGMIVGGQVFTDKPDSHKISSLSRSLGIDAAEFEAAAESAETSTEQRVDAAANLLSQMVEEAAETGYLRAVSAEKGTLARESLNDDGSNSVIKQKIGIAADRVTGVEKGCERIKNAVAESAKAVDSTDTIIKNIEDSSTQLTLIGFNASIEAKRAGSAGVGFNVIAQQVRTLADKNSKQATTIEHTLSGIKKSMNGINNQIRELYRDIEKISSSMNELSLAALESENEETE